MYAWMKWSASATLAAVVLAGCEGNKNPSARSVSPVVPVLADQAAVDPAQPAAPGAQPVPVLPPAPSAGAITGAVPASMPAMAAVTEAVAVITPTTGNKVGGKVTFTQTDAGVKVVADVSDLPPGKHGFHIHEYGDTSDAAKAMSTGGHFDPEGTHHHELVAPEHPEHPDAAPHHAGDMGNLTADDSGKAHLEVTLAGVTLMGPLNPIVGRAVIVHEKPDDGGQPTGNAGGRIAYGVIGIAKAK